MRVVDLIITKRDGGQLAPEDIRAFIAAYSRDELPDYQVAALLMAVFFQGLDAYVMPSRITPDHEEHDAHALIEAMCFGLPSIGSRCGIIPEILEDGSGLLCDAGDPRSLADELEQLVRSPSLRDELGAKALAKAQTRYSLEAVAARRFAVYEQLLREA